VAVFADYPLLETTIFPVWRKWRLAHTNQRLRRLLREKAAGRAASAKIFNSECRVNPTSKKGLPLPNAGYAIVERISADRQRRLSKRLIRSIGDTKAMVYVAGPFDACLIKPIKLIFRHALGDGWITNDAVPKIMRHGNRSLAAAILQKP